MATQPSIDQVQSMYIGYYGRPGDPSGTNYWAERLDSTDGNLDAIIEQFGSSPEYTERFSNLSNSELINQFYQNTFGRDADSAGLNYYLQNLEAGVFTLASIAKNIWDGATTGDDAAITTNKLSVANYFTSQIETQNKNYGSDDINDAVTLLQNVTESSSTVTSAQSSADTLISNMDSDSEPTTPSEPETPVSQPSNQPTDQEQYMLELINRARLDPEGEAARLGLDLNEGLAAGTISSTPSQALAFNNELTASAQDHNEWLLAENAFSHTGENGTSPFQRIEAAGYEYTTAGENIGYQATTATISNPAPFTAGVHDDLFIDAGVDGRGHRINILQDAFKEIGIAVDLGVRDVTFNTVMATQNFGTSDASQAILLGVVFDDTDNNNFYTPGEGQGSVQIQITDNSGDSVTTYSMDAGGYQIELDAGVYDITFTNNGATHTVDDVSIGSDNVKVDWMI